jgi:hypothetical protein
VVTSLNALIHSLYIRILFSSLRGSSDITRSQMTATVTSRLLYSRSTMELEGFRAWIVAKDEELPTYRVELSADGKTSTCWIASEAGTVHIVCSLAQVRDKVPCALEFCRNFQCIGRIPCQLGPQVSRVVCTSMVSLAGTQQLPHPLLCVKLLPQFSLSLPIPQEISFSLSWNSPVSRFYHYSD